MSYLYLHGALTERLNKTALKLQPGGGQARIYGVVISIRCWFCRAAIPETASDGDKPAQKETSVALAIAADPDVSDDNSIDLSTYRSSVDQVKAIAAKISTARRLARKLAEEKAAVSAISDGDSREAELYDIVACLPCMRLRRCPSSRTSCHVQGPSYPEIHDRMGTELNRIQCNMCLRCRIRRKTQLNSAEAAASAARADALARSSKLKITSTRSREAARLAAENKALLEVLTTVADGNPSIQAKLQAIRRKYPVGSKVRFLRNFMFPVYFLASRSSLTPHHPRK